MGVVVPFVIPRRDSSVERLDYSVERVGGRVAAILDALDRSSQSKSPCPRPASEILTRAQFSLEIILHSKSRVRASRSRSEGRPLSLRRVIPPSAITTRGSRQARRRLVMIHSRVGESPTLPARSRRTLLGTLAASARRGPSPHVVTLARGLRRLRAAPLRLSSKPFGERPFRPRPERASHRITRLCQRLFCSNELRLGRWKPFIPRGRL